MVGRRAEALRLLRLADEADSIILRNGEVPPAVLLDIAGNEAVLGRHAKAVALAEQAFSRGWRVDPTIDGEIGQNPLFATLRGDPRFEQLRRINIAWRDKERREVAALGLI